MEINNGEEKQEQIINENSQMIKNENENSPKHSFFNINDLINHVGYNSKVLTIIGINYLFFFLMGYIIEHLLIITVAFKHYYQTNNFTVSLIVILSFIGVVIGNFSFPFLMKIMDRRNLTIVSGAGMLISNILLSSIHSIYIFGIFRLFLTAFSGISNVCVFNVMMEYLPAKFKNFIATSVWIFYNFATLLFLLFLHFYIPDLQYILGRKDVSQDFYFPMFHFNYFFILYLILIIIFLEDSPRNLILNGKTDQAKKILESYIDRQLTEEEINSIKENIINTGENKHIKSEEGYLALFTKRLFMISILLISLFSLNVCCFVSIGAIFPIILIRFFNSGTDFIPFTYLLINTILKTCGTILISFVAEFKMVGYKFNILILIIISIISAIIGVFYLKVFKVLTIISIVSLEMTKSAIYSWVTMIFPTRLRDKAVSLCLFSSRLLGCLIQGLLIYISFNNLTLSMSLYIVILIITGIILLFLPKNEIEDVDSEIQTLEEDEEMKAIKENKQN